MKNTENNKQISTKKPQEHLHSHTSNEEKTLKKFYSDNPELAKRLHEIDLSKVRICQKNLVYVIGLSHSIAKEDLLVKNEYFGQYGHVLKIVVYKTNNYNRNQKYSPALSAYLTFSDEKEASLAIFAVDGLELLDKTLHCSYGTTKYCTYFLKDQNCPNRSECVYLHFISKEHEYYYLNNHKNGTEDQRNSLLSVLRKYKQDFHLQVMSTNKPEHQKTVLPSIFKIICDLNNIFSNESENNGSKQNNKPLLSKSHSTSSDDKNIGNLSQKKENCSLMNSSKKTKTAHQKLLNTVDWEEDEKNLQKQTSRGSVSEKTTEKTPELHSKVSEEIMQNSNEKPHGMSQNSNNCNKNEENSKLSMSNEKSDKKIPEEEPVKEFKCSLEDDCMKLGDANSLSIEIHEENEKKSLLNNDTSANNNKNIETSSPNSYKISFESQNDPLFSPLNFGNDIEMKIIKNMLNETNQKSRFAFVQSAEKKNKEETENSLKEILLSSLKFNELKRSSSLNVNDTVEKDSNEKKTSYYSHIAEGENISAKLFNFNDEHKNNRKASLFNNDNNDIIYEFNMDYYKNQ